MARRHSPSRSPPVPRLRSPPSRSANSLPQKSFRARSSSPEPQVTDAINLSSEDCAFILGAGGATKDKLALVSGASLNLEERDSTLHIRGSEIQVSRAHEYINFVLSQRNGSKVQIQATHYREDLSIVDVPEDCVAYIMGKGGKVLRSIEEEWGTLMFFAEVKGGKYHGTEKLAIFGNRRARRGAELKVMSGVEHKKPGHFVTSQGCLRRPLGQPGDQDTANWSNETMVLGPEDLSYALGSMGTTRKKLATASGCILEYLGKCVVMSGTHLERARAKDYLGWLLQQRQGPVHVDSHGRDDVAVARIPRECTGFITGAKGGYLRETERMSGTFCFFNSADKHGSSSHEELLIFSSSAASRQRAEEIIEEKVAQYKPVSRFNQASRQSSRERSPRRGYGRQRFDYDRGDHDRGFRDRGGHGDSTGHDHNFGRGGYAHAHRDHSRGREHDRGSGYDRHRRHRHSPSYERSRHRDRSYDRYRVESYR